MNKRMNRARMNIGVYCFDEERASERKVKELAECGVDFVIMQNKREIFDLFSKYGIGAVVSGVLPGWWGGADGLISGKMAESNPIVEYEKAVDDFEDHPAIWGVDCGDEPSAKDFEHYGKVVDLVNERIPNAFAYANLFPSYGSVGSNTQKRAKEQLATDSFEEYIEEYCKKVNTDYVCFDFYPYSCNTEAFYKDLAVVSECCKRYGKSMWVVLQVNSSEKNVFTSENRLRFQAFSAMAFGAENIIWACYAGGWWYHQVLDESGEKTEQYDKLKRINGEIKTLAEEYMKYRREKTEITDEGKRFSAKKVSELYSQDGARLLVGEFSSRKGEGSAVFVFAADDPMDEKSTEHSVVFRSDAKEIKGYGREGCIEIEKLQEKEYRVTIKSNDGIFITLE